jgi:predicted amidophosphoribosyltransferase
MTNDATIEWIIMTCKGICIRHKALRSHHHNGNRYSTGQKRCQVCQIFLKWDGLWCPCCGYRLRMRPRNLNHRAKVRAREKIAKYQLLSQQEQKVKIGVYVRLKYSIIPL